MVQLTQARRGASVALSWPDYENIFAWRRPSCIPVGPETVEYDVLGLGAHGLQVAGNAGPAKTGRGENTKARWRGLAPFLPCQGRIPDLSAPPGNGVGLVASQS